ncbi:Tetratricopeptide repeat protein [Enhygromyxa salina]|uniref:Tetratricopeptide repeat protein n=1 Tax=Enhygromyxa salina TaxID=215803 RepID=A0A2S9YYT9_9BACT|nr:Tetratricopeptide repeat protein [Enhygromyxa salina]
MLVCLADGYAAQGNNGRANQFFDRALSQSPSNKLALRGAAKAAAQTGATERATDLYERLLKVDPGNAAAKAFLAKNNPSKPDPEPAPQPEPTPPADTGG